MLFFLLALACNPTAIPDDPADPLPGCGNGILEPDEQCDDGADNSDSEPDACRTSCRTPICGDGVADANEQCDDGNEWGGDGCTPECLGESGAFETEPNDNWADAETVTEDTVNGALSAGAGLYPCRDIRRCQR